MTESIFFFFCFSAFRFSRSSGAFPGRSKIGVHQHFGGIIGNRVFPINNKGIIPDMGSKALKLTLKFSKFRNLLEKYKSNFK